MNILPFLQNNNSFAVVITRAARSSVLLILSPSAVPDKTNIKLIGLLAMRSDRSEHWHYYICLHQHAFINICQATKKMIIYKKSCTWASSTCIVWCIMVKIGGRKKTRKSCKKHINGTKTGEIVKSRRKWSFFRIGGCINFVEIGEKLKFWVND